jgi:SAM-dependent methyltransferase
MVPQQIWIISDTDETTVSTLLVPVLPNRPLAHRDEPFRFGRISLRRHSGLSFTENALFDPNLVEYDENYQNSQALSDIFRQHMYSVIEVLKRHLTLGSRIVEVGCGKGQFIEMLDADGHFISQGFDSAYEGDRPNITRRYLTGSDRIDADAIVLRHVIEHIPRPHEFLRMLSQVFGDVLVYCEVPDFSWILDNQAFFDITYEHVNYFTSESLSRLFGGEVVAIENSFGGQYIYLIARLSKLSTAFHEEYSGERDWHVMDYDGLFPSLSRKMKLIEETFSGRRIHVWGAATKGCMFLYHCQRLGYLNQQIFSMVDINPAKWGKFAPGTAVPITAPETLLESLRSNDAVVIANPIYESEIRFSIAKSPYPKTPTITL